MKIKVCGITSVSALQALQQAGIDYAGLIFYPGSKRYVGSSLNAAEVYGTEIKKIGVFVNGELNDVRSLAALYNLFALQLHGSESPAYCTEVKKYAKVIKAISVAADTNLEKETASYNNSVDYFLFDTKLEGEKGGTGQRFDWALLQNYSGTTPFFLSGGISVEDAAAIRTINHPQLFAVDINSRFEIAPGIKDLNLVGQFSNNLNGH